jgi:hypothetical protein
MFCCGRDVIKKSHSKLFVRGGTAHYKFPRKAIEAYDTVKRIFYLEKCQSFRGGSYENVSAACMAGSVFRNRAYVVQQTVVHSICLWGYRKFWIPPKSIWFGMPSSFCLPLEYTLSVLIGFELY